MPQKDDIRAWLANFGKQLGKDIFEPIGEGLYTGIKTAAANDQQLQDKVVNATNNVNRRADALQEQITQLNATVAADITTVATDGSACSKYVAARNTKDSANCR